MLELRKPIIIGAMHLPRFGRWNPKTSIEQLEDYALANCGIFVNNGLTTLYIQDENPSAGKANEETIAVVASLGRLLKKEYPALSLGVVVEAHDAIAPLAIAHACGADFVRIKVFAGAMLKAPGVQQGCGIEAVHYRTAICSSVKIFADAHDRTGYPLVDVPIGTVAGWVAQTGADAVILTGMSYAQSLAYLDEGKAVLGNKPALIGGGVTIGNIAEILQHADGAIVSTSLMSETRSSASLRMWDSDKIRRFVDAVAAVS